MKILAKDYSELVEKRANAFAAAFLMPRGGVHAFLAKFNKGPTQPTKIHHA